MVTTALTFFETSSARVLDESNYFALDESNYLLASLDLNAAFDVINIFRPIYGPYNSYPEWYSNLGQSRIALFYYCKVLTTRPPRQVVELILHPL